MCAIDMSNLCGRRCKCTGLRAPRPNLSSRARSIRWILLFSTWRWSSKHYSDQFLPDYDQNNCKIVLLTSSPTGFLHCKADGQRQEGEMVFPRSGESRTFKSSLQSITIVLILHCCDILWCSMIITIATFKTNCQVCVEGEKYSLVQSNGTFTITINKPEASDTGRYKCPPC